MQGPSTPVRTPANTASWILILLALAGAGAAAGLGQAAEGFMVLINGVDVTGLVSQKFEGCTVTFDDKGNIHIDAPGYQIKKVTPPDGTGNPGSAVEKAPPPSEKHYYFYTEAKNGKLVADKYSLIVNGTVVKQFESTDELIVEDITSSLVTGTNQILITAMKTDSYTSGSTKDYFRIVIGEGQEEENKAVIEKTLHKFTRTAGDAEPGQSAYTLKAK